MSELNQGSNTQSEKGKPVVQNTELPSTAPATEKIPLSPPKEALRVAVIWLFIIGVPVWVLYFVYLFPFWVGVGVFLEDRWRKKHDLVFLPRRFINWLLASWLWEIFVRRCYVGSKNALQLRGLAEMSLMIGGFLSLCCFSITPPVELAEMRMVTGTLESWKLQSRLEKGGCGDIVTLRLEDGRSENFFNGREIEAYYRQLDGQEVTIWVQSSADDLMPNCRKFENVTQLQHGGRIIGLPYDKARYEKADRFVFKTAKFFIWTGLFFLLLVWLINRRKKQ